MKLLVTTSRSLLMLDSATGDYRPVHQGAGLYYGIAATPRHYLVAARHRMVSSTLSAEDERGEILVFDLSLRYVGCWRAPFALRDIHEIKWHRRHLWVTCSYDNMVALRQPNGQWRQWYPLGEPQGQPRDTHHFNSLYLAGKHVWLLAHNRGPSEILQFTWPDFILRSRETLGCQAHNLWREKGGWSTCSSAEGCIASQHGITRTTGGFPRGIARLDKGWAVGVSAMAERGQRDYSSGKIVLFDNHWRMTRQIPLHEEGLVLDLLPFRQDWRGWMKYCLASDR